MNSLICEVPTDVDIPPHFVIDLDQPSTLRWQHIVHLYRDQLLQVETKIESMVRTILGNWLGTAVESIVANLMSGITKAGLVFYGEEIKGIAKDSGIALGKMALMQFVYECFACCTSIICKDPITNTPMQIRSMDWGLDFLKKLTIDVDFQKGGRTIFKATTWIGYVGILTGMRIEQGYSVAVNFRVTNGAWSDNLKMAITRGWPIGFLVREVLEVTNNYTEAVEQFSQSELIAPCYFTICGTKQSRDLGALLTRRRKSEDKRLNLEQHGTIVQTNIDHWSDAKDENILFSLERRALAMNFFSENRIINEVSLWNLLSKNPILNDLTIYGTFMCPEYGIYHTRHPKTRTGFQSYQDVHFIQLSDIVSGKAEFDSNTICLPLLSVQKSYTCHKCSKEFGVNENQSGECIHTGKWHTLYEDCSYLKCGFNLAKKGSLGLAHWSCCYSLDKQSQRCCKSPPHTYIK